ncbi:hypothetical protein EJ02DRAFT_157798 [Clathrospora elynae]|uniref:Uncharacterized protein n=1 Tax=Clathrospora elynae TaxID=706981 RepID=A0A6A5SWA4_9PLEO|nr:hypothetical protein EJ02DRAFT_157798 [Clathrospora elynae]
MSVLNSMRISNKPPDSWLSCQRRVPGYRVADDPCLDLRLEIESTYRESATSLCPKRNCRRPWHAGTMCVQHRRHHLWVRMRLGEQSNCAHR